MLWTNTTLSHLHYIFVTYTSCGLYVCLLCINLGLESQYFLNMLNAVKRQVITIIARMSPYRFTAIFH